MAHRWITVDGKEACDAYYERIVDQARHQIVRRQAMYQELARRARGVGAS